MNTHRWRRTALVVLLAAGVLAVQAGCGRGAPLSAVLYVTDETGGNVVVVNPDSGEVMTRIPVGKRPRGILAARDGSTLLVALSGSPIAGPGVDESTLPPPDRAADGIGLVDIASGRLVRTLPSGQDPETFDLSADGMRIFVSNEETAELSAVDVQAGTILGRAQVGGEPEGVTVRPDGRLVYVTAEADNAVYAVDVDTLQVQARIETDARPRSVAFSRDGSLGFVAAENSGAVTVFDPATAQKVATIAIPPTAGTPTPPRPMGSVVSPDGRELYVSLGRSRSIAVIDIAGRRYVRSIEDVGTRPWGIAVSPDGRKLYTANGPSGDVSVVDLASGTVERRIDVGGSPWGVVAVRP